MVAFFPQNQTHTLDFLNMKLSPLELNIPPSAAHYWSVVPCGCSADAIEAAARFAFRDGKTQTLNRSFLWTTQELFSSAPQPSIVHTHPIMQAVNAVVWYWYIVLIVLCVWKSVKCRSAFMEVWLSRDVLCSMPDVRDPTCRYARLRCPVYLLIVSSSSHIRMNLKPPRIKVCLLIELCQFQCVSVCN